MKAVIALAISKLRRDLSSGASPRVVLMRAARYSSALVGAKLYLNDVTELGRGVRCDGKPRIENHGIMKIGAHTVLNSVVVPVELACGENALLEIQDHCAINYGVSIGCTHHVSIGSRCRLGPYSMIIDTQFHDLYDRLKRPPGKPTVLESDVWVGAKANIMPGVRIGRGSVVGTGAVVTKDVEPFSVVAGIPAKVIDRLDPEKFLQRVPSDE